MGEIGRPFGASSESVPPIPPNMVDCEPAIWLSAAHALPSLSMAMPPRPASPPPCVNQRDCPSTGSKQEVGPERRRAGARPVWGWIKVIQQGEKLGGLIPRM